MERTLEPEAMDDAHEVEAYEAMDHRAVNGAFVERLVELGASGYCLDIGTGNGLIPLAVVDRLPEAVCVGVDLSQAMIDAAMRHRTVSHAANRVTFKRTDGKRLPFDDGEFDVVFSNSLVHHLDNPVPFLREAWRVLRPGGVLLIRDLFRPTDEAAVESLVTEHAANDDDFGKQLLRQSLMAAFTPDELRAIVNELGWPNVEVTVDSDRHVSIQTGEKTTQE